MDVKKVALYGSIDEKPANPPESNAPKSQIARDAKQRNLGSSIVF